MQALAQVRASHVFVVSDLAALHGESLEAVRLRAGDLAVFGKGFAYLPTADARKIGKKLEGIMGSCCGGNADPVLRAKAAMGIPVNGVSANGAVSPAGSVRLEYLGENLGGIPYKANGRMYIGANNDVEKYVDARPEDVEPLERTGRWRVVDGNTGMVILEYAGQASQWFNDEHGTARWQGGPAARTRWITVSAAEADFILNRYGGSWKRVTP